VSIQDQVIQIIAEQALLQPDDVKLADKPEDLGLDSMGLVESIFAIEDQHPSRDARGALRDWPARYPGC